MTSPPSRVNRLKRHEYEFASDWRLPASFEDVFDVLKDLWSYPDWWPQFKHADQFSDSEGRFALRSALPFTLNFTLVREVQDAETGHLRARADGDIRGTVEWRIEVVSANESVAHFRQEVELMHGLARPFDAALRPALEWNHGVAMRDGLHGLLRRLRA